MLHARNWAYEHKRNSFYYHRVSSFMKEARQIIRWSRQHVIILIKPTTWGIYRTLELLKCFLNIISLKLYESLVYEVWLPPIFRGRNQGSGRWYNFSQTSPTHRCQMWDTALVCGPLQAIPFTVSLFSSLMTSVTIEGVLNVTGGPSLKVSEISVRFSHEK